MGELILWTSPVGFKNVNNNKTFFAYSDKTPMNCLQIIIPFSAVCTFEPSADQKEGIQFYCYEKELW